MTLNQKPGTQKLATKTVPADYTLARKVLTGVADPSGLRLQFQTDGSHITAAIAPGEDICGKARVVPSSVCLAVAEDAAHAGLAALRKRVGMARECSMRFIKPLYVGEPLRVDAVVHKEAGDVVVLRVRLITSKEAVACDADIEMFALSAEAMQRMLGNAPIAPELRKYLP